MTQAPVREERTSLYALTLEAQEVDGQLAIAFGLACSEDPEEQAQAEAMIGALLQQGSDNQAARLQKANAICHIHQGLLAKADFLRQIAADRIEKAKAEERAAKRLLNYMVGCLAAANPGQKKFPLPEFTITNRPSETVEIETDTDEVTGKEVPLVGPDYCRFEIKLKLEAGHAEQADQVVAVITETLRDVYELPGSAYVIKVERSVDKALLKPKLKAGETIDGASLSKNDNWSIK
jgi:hypothetical protein